MVVQDSWLQKLDVEEEIREIWTGESSFRHVIRNYEIKRQSTSGNTKFELNIDLSVDEVYLDHEHWVNLTRPETI